MSRLEAPVVAEVLLALGSRPDCRVFRNNSGALRDPAGRLVRFGLGPGSADIIGLLLLPSGVGRALAIECKSDTGRLRPEQVAWRAMWLRFGGIHILARSAADAVAGVEAALASQETP